MNDSAVSNETWDRINKAEIKDKTGKKNGVLLLLASGIVMAAIGLVNTLPQKNGSEPIQTPTPRSINR
jgi:hypothetical protein